jgi:Tol biopolymer transport system component
MSGRCSRIAIATALACLIALGVTDARAQCSSAAKIGSDIQISVNRGQTPVIAWNGSEFGMVWADGSDCDLYFARLDTDGNIIATNQVNEVNSVCDYEPEIVWNGSEYGVAWAQQTSGSNYVIVFTRLSSIGEKLAIEQTVSGGHPGTVPDMVWNGTGWALVWQSAGQAHVAFVRLDASGTPIAPANLLTGHCCGEHWPQIAWNGSHYGVIWYDGSDHPSGLQWSTYFKLLDASGIEQTTVRLDDDATSLNLNNRGLPSIASDGSNFLAVWTGSDNSNLEFIWSRQLDATGTPTGPQNQASLGADSTDADLVWNGTEYGLAWQSYFPGNWEIYYRTLAPDGTRVGGDRRITNDAGRSENPALAWNGDGYGVVWHDDRTGTSHAYFARVGCCDDDDSDGMSDCAGDCDDFDPDVYPGAPQICDGRNNDCNFGPPDVLVGTNEYDDDSDGMTECGGDCDDTVASCTTSCVDGDGDGLYICAGDCDDTRASCTTNCADNDGDGLALCQGDCNDGNPDCVLDCTDSDADGLCNDHDGCPTVADDPTPVKLNMALSPTGLPGVQSDYRITEDSSTVVYRVIRNSLNIIELYSVPARGGASTQLNAPMVGGGDVLGFAVSPNSKRAVYLADQDTDTRNELYSVFVVGGTPVKLNGTLQPNGDVLTYAIDSTSSRVVYRADKDIDGVTELYSAPIAGGTATKLHAPLPAGRVVNTFAISPDGTKVVYIADQDADNVFELYSVPIAGGTPLKLNGSMVTGGNVGIFEISPDSATVVYRADAETNDVFELYAVPIAGGASVKLNRGLITGGDVADYSISPNSADVVYRADARIDDITELFSVPITGGISQILNEALVTGGDVASFAISPDSATVAYRADQDTDEVIELYSVPLLGGTPVKLNDALPSTGDVTHVAISADSATAVYRADPAFDGNFRLYSVPLLGGTPTSIGGPMKAFAEGVQTDFSVSPDSVTVLFRKAENSGIYEVYSTSMDGSSYVQLNPDMPLDRDVEDCSISRDSTIVVYRADADRDGVQELYSVARQFNDEDGDGAGAHCDCDESRTEVRPGGFQVCDGLNNDCTSPTWPGLAGTNEHDDDGDALSECQGDCNDADSDTWAVPGETRNLVFLADKVTLRWSAPLDPGGNAPWYDTIRSDRPDDFTDGACVETDDGEDTEATTTTTPPVGGFLGYLGRAENSCGSGSWGIDSFGQPRDGIDCP